jgi:large subunit ribosomal protein L22
MGARKHRMAEKIKEAKKTLYIAKLNNNPTSPRKTRYTADLIRGLNVDKALAVLKFSHREAAPKLHKLLRSAISNWQNKNEGVRMEDADLFVKEIFVDGGTQVKRLRTAPQGRGYRIRKRSNHVTVILGSRVAVAAVETPHSEQPENLEQTEQTSETKPAVAVKKPIADRKTAVNKRPLAARKFAAKPVTKAAATTKTTRTKKGA